MPKIITLTSQKGGVGKSTLALCTYFALVNFSDGLRVCIIDTDDQRSIQNLVKMKELDIDVLDKFQPDKMEAYDISIVDTPPKLTKGLIEIYKQSDLLLIPSKIGMFDIVSTIDTFETIRTHAPNAKAFAILNMVNSVARINAEAVETFKANDIPLFKSTIGNRLAYTYAQFQNGNIFGQRNGKAKAEITALTTEIYSKLI